MEKPTNEFSAVPVESTQTWWQRLLRAVVVVVVGFAIGAFVYTNATTEDSDYSFKLGLDLAGGSQLIYQADVSDVFPEEIPQLMNTLRDVIERRINVFGVSEPIVQVERSSFVAGEVQHRLLVELPGITDVSEAVAEIGRTPLLEFKLVDQEVMSGQQEDVFADIELSTTSTTTQADIQAAIDDAMPNPYIDTGLTGRFLESARLDFSSQQGGSVTNEPIVLLNFNREGANLFEEITAANVGEQLAIFLDGEVLSSPRINERIAGGTAVISGGFNRREAQELAQNLNFGALPIPIELVSTQTIGATLGAEVLERGISAGIIGFSFVFAFMFMWYRVPGIVAAVALSTYVAAMLALFMFIPVTLTAAGLAGFVLSLGMAVDANVLVFERMKELFREGRSSRISAYEGFARAWSAIRDGNVTSLLSAIILFWFGTSMVQGFALVFGIGIIVSMLTALLVTRSLLVVLPEVTESSSTLSQAAYHSGLQK